MMDRIMVLCAYGVLLCFLGILIWHVPRLDLGGIALITLLLAAVDTVHASRGRNESESSGKDTRRMR
ncbi:hypothetical protein [Paracoccus beibuensis]|uniref:hypothetical protein n=1 Tax=Paracoccus beibuensis TaxID=547602 RepID=UPI00223FF17E|nr:hypothetical protein [Paracoccus beibuensis]